MQFPLGA